jgi:hypothetical protein
VRLVEPLDKGIGRLEEPDLRRAVVHRHDPLRAQAVDDLMCLAGVNRRTGADGQKDQVDVADRRRLLVA